MIFNSYNEKETENIAEKLAVTLKSGDIITLYGDLGVGKTAFCRGLARGLGIAQRVTSPTFTIVNEYSGGALPLFHFDMYRLGGSDELFELGFDDYTERGGVVAVEWSERVADAMPPDAIKVTITRTGETERTIEITGSEL
ncbi:MAG: tRNA (adenosine(37)-N6)-threonylcarbamoyltransferase complex ATPase subunit type 1 TsaE [Oscillospiraceae bacterium]|nr:tRNA (adenosine(37)-N6)-threonylcarbamoyltransferase complex ATPase subunit type 1 TsaE [Oscillospiraceae bacterium]